MSLPKALHTSLLVMLRPVARLCLRSGVGIQEFIEAAKLVFISVAREQFERESKKPNKSRISVATGIHRRDVDRLLERGEEPIEPANLISRVMTAWNSKAEFLTAVGKTRVLSCEGEPNEFYDLVRSVTSDVHPSSILNQMEVLGLVERTSHGLRLKRAAHDVRQDLARGYHILSQDLEDLAAAVECNLLTQPTVPNLHARTEFDNVFVDALPEIRQWLLKEGSELHQRARALFSQNDADLQIDPGRKAGAKVIFTCFARIEDGKEKV